MALSVDKYLLKIFFIISFAIFMLFFSIMFSLHFMIEKNTDSDCIQKLDPQPLYTLGRGINSRSIAEKLMDIYAKDNIENADIRFLNSGAEFCGSTFVFIDRNSKTKYAICSDGKIYKYTCTT